MKMPGFYKLFQDKWGQYQSIYLISDTHFDEDELKQAYHNRPSDEELLAAINAKVGKKDILIHLGDVGSVDFAKRLKGYKILITGNHEKGKTAYEDAFQEIYEGPLCVGEKLILSHEPIPNLTWALNLHGHIHSTNAKNDKWHYNINPDATGLYEPIHLGAWLKMGPLANIESLHRATIDFAVERRAKKGKKYGI